MTAAEEGGSVTLRDEAGVGRFRVSGLNAQDATGRILPTRMVAKSGALDYSVDTAGARWPVVVDPVYANLAAELSEFDDGESFGLFGSAMAMDDLRAVVGAPNKTINGAGQSGAAYVFQLFNNSSWSHWQLQARLTASDGAGGDHFGSAVAINGTTVVVGAYNKTHGAASSAQGEAYVFVQSGSTWSQQAILTASDGTLGDTFGTSVAVSGNLALVGAPRKTVGSQSGRGKVYVYSRTGTAWTEDLTPIAVSMGLAESGFGSSVSLDGALAAIGAPGPITEGGPTEMIGAAYVFGVSGTTLIESKLLVPSDGGLKDQFGAAVAIKGTRVLVGAPSRNQYQGAAYLFTQSGNDWLETTLVPADGAAYDRYGASVALSKNNLAVGAPSNHGIAFNWGHGKAYVSSLVGGWAWTALVTANPVNGSAFGNSVAVSDDVVDIVVLVGVPHATVNDLQERGSVYEFSPGPWRQYWAIGPSEGTPGDALGTSVAVDGKLAVVGAPSKDVGYGDRAGAAYVFAESGLVWQL